MAFISMHYTFNVGLHWPAIGHMRGYIQPNLKWFYGESQVVDYYIVTLVFFYIVHFTTKMSDLSFTLDYTR